MTAYRLLGWQRPPELVAVPVPEVGADQVLVEVAGCGLCHSDLTMVAMPGEVGEALGWEVPFTLGHEVAGRVVEVGAEVDGAVVGDPVVLGAPSCGSCAQHHRARSCKTVTHYGAARTKSMKHSTVRALPNRRAHRCSSADL